MSGPLDIFICHDPASAQAVKRLTAALAARGVTFFVLQAGAEDGLQPKLAMARSFLIWGSEAFFLSRSCQKHLAMAYVVHQQTSTGGPERILLINAESGLKHIYPLHLRERVMAAAPGLPNAPDFTVLAEQIQARCQRLEGTSGNLYLPPHEGWLEPFGGMSQEPVHFFGRERELWQLHDALSALGDPVPSDYQIPYVVLSGAAGLGKSWLAREYCFRFGAAWPGGIYRISAREATPVIRRCELGQNPPLKSQLLALHERLCSDHVLDAGIDLTTLTSHVGDLLQLSRKPFLWIVDDLPEGINGPALRQWLAPGSLSSSGRTLLITRSQRYDNRAESIHLPVLDEVSGGLLVTQGKLPGRTDELNSVIWLLDEVGRHPRYAAMIAALQEHNRRKKGRTYSGLLQKIVRTSRQANELVAQEKRLLPELQQSGCATVLLEALKTLQGPARDILRLAAELEDYDLPLDFIAECLDLSGLGPEDDREEVFRIIINEPQEIPFSLETARKYTEIGADTLVSFALAERTDNTLRIFPLAIRAMGSIIPGASRQPLLREAALQAIYTTAQSGQDARLSILAPHGRKLLEDLKDRRIDPDENSAEVNGRIRLSIHLADMDLKLGARQRAINLYRATSAYLVRSMAIDPTAGSRQKDFARIQEQLGDLLTEQKKLLVAQDHYRKSLGIRTFMSAQLTIDLERLEIPLRLHQKIGCLQKSLDDIDGAMQSQQAAHVLHHKRLLQSPLDPSLEFAVASSHAEMAELGIALDHRDEAMSHLGLALKIFEKLSASHPQELAYVRAPLTVHNLMGNLLYARDDLSGALDRYRTALVIGDSASSLDPGNPELQRDIAICHNHIADTLVGLDDPVEAQAHFEAFLAIAGQPANLRAFEDIRGREIAVVHIKLGRIQERSKALESALDHYLKARSLIASLAIDMPENTLLRDDMGWLRDRIERVTERRDVELRRQARASQSYRKI